LLDHRVLLYLSATGIKFAADDGRQGLLGDFHVTFIDDELSHGDVSGSKVS